MIGGRAKRIVMEENKMKESERLKEVIKHLKFELTNWIEKEKKSIYDPGDEGFEECEEMAQGLDEGEQTRLMVLSEIEEKIESMDWEEK